MLELRDSRPGAKPAGTQTGFDFCNLGLADLWRTEDKERLLWGFVGHEFTLWVHGSPP